MLLGTSCANFSRVLQPDDRLLYRNRYEITMSDGSKVPPEVHEALKDVEKYVRQQPRNGFFNIHHSFVNTYYTVSPTDSSWWAGTMRVLGTAPAIYNESQSATSARQIEGLLTGHGCFHSTVSVDTQHLSHRRLVATYHIKATPRHVIDDISYRTTDTAIRPLIERWRETSPLQVGDYYDQDNLISERDRIATRLRYNGYFLANTDLIRFVVDTTYASQRLGIDVIIDNPRVENADHSVEVRPFQKYYINDIAIDSNNVRESTIRHVLTLQPGMQYSPARTTSTYNALLNLRNFNIVNIEYRESPSSGDDTRMLDTRIRLHNTNQQKISASLEISNASPISRESSNSGSFGTEAVLQYQHRNLFGGAEILSIEGNFLVELSKSILRNGSSHLNDNISAFETGISLSLDLPRFLFPFGSSLLKGSALPHTLFSAGIETQHRTYFERRQANTSFGYTWNASRTVQHKISIAELSYVQFPSFSAEFQQRIASMLNNRLLYQYSDHLILDTRYEFTFSDQRIGRQIDFSYLNASVETAGNLAALVATAPGMRRQSDIGYTLVGVAYSQYARFSGEAKHYFYHGAKSVFVARTLIGFGLPYGNSFSMPYEKSFFGGGPNNIRAWQIRHLGPGHMQSDDSYDRTGDMTLVFNFEERFPIAGPVEGALFADMGNVWLYRENKYMPGADFKLKNIGRDMAMGLGLGLRLKISILTLRLDFAMPARDPSYDSGERWRFRQWRFSTLTTNFGIDYPF